MRMKKTISLFLSLALILTMMSGIGPMQTVEAYEDTDFFTEKEAVTDYAYSFAVVGDTQIVTEYDVEHSTTHLAGIYDWILENQASKNIEYVFGLGDITDNNKKAEWSLAQTQLKKLDGVIPYSLVRGNHDLVGVGTPEDATADYFTQYLGTDAYKEQFADGGFYSEDNTWNSWRTFTVGDVDYLMLALDWGASDAVLSWASTIIEEYSTYNVIITTHGYLFGDGTTVGAGEGGMSTADNNGEAMWNKLISKHENIVLVMSGHVPSEDIIVSQDEGEHGNIVTSMLIDPQDVDQAEVNAGNIPLGAVAMLYFSEDGKDVQVEYYATARDSYFKECNQFNLELDTVSKEVDDCERIVKEYSAEDVAAFIAGDNYYPTLEGYVFAGWYTDEACDENCVLAGKTPSGTTYALFLPEHMLDVKAQVSANLIDSDNTNDETASIRFITTIDSLLYEKAGFKLSYKNADGDTLSVKTASKSVGRKLYVLDGSTKWGKTPEGTFCGVSKYFKACILRNLSKDVYYDTVFTVEPFWVTLDGDVVYGKPVEKSLKQGYESSNVKIDIKSSENGTVATDDDAYRWGNTVTLNVTPDNTDYLCSSLKIGEWDVANDLVANDDGTYSYSFTAMDDSYTVTAEFERKIFKDKTTSKWNTSKQFEGEISTTISSGGTTTADDAVLYDQYKDIDITLKGVKHRSHYDSTKTFGGRMDIMFQFDVDGDGVYTKSTAKEESKDRHTSFGIMTTDTNKGTTLIRTLGIAEPYSGAGDAGKAQWITGTTRQKALYTLSADEVKNYQSEDGVEFRVVRLGTVAYVYLDGKQVVEFDLTQNNSGVTADTKAIVTLRYYEGVGEVVVPFEISNTVDPIFTTTGATGTWDLTDKYNGMVSVNSTAVSDKQLVLPLAKEYGDIDISLNGVKENKKTANDSYSRTDILFEFDTVNGTKTTSVGLIYKNNCVTVETLGIKDKHITSTRQLPFITYAKDSEEGKAYIEGDGVDLRVIREGTYLYVFINEKQVGMLDLAQNSSGVTADMKVKVSLRHYGVQAEKIEFNYEISDELQEVELDIASAEEGTVTANTVSHIVYDEGSAASMSKAGRECVKHFSGEFITFTVTLNDNANLCTGVKVNEKDALLDEDGTYSFVAMDKVCTVTAEFARKIFKDKTTSKWNTSKQFEGEISTTISSSLTTADDAVLYDQYKDIDITLKGVKHRSHYDSTKTFGGRMDIMFQFDVDGDGVYTKSTAKEESKDRHTSFGIMTTDTNKGTTLIRTLGIAEPYSGAGDAGKAQWITGTTRQKALYTLSADEVKNYQSEDGVEFRVVRLGTVAYVYLDGKQVVEFDLTQNNSGVTADTKAIVTLRYYEGAGEVVVPFEISDTVNPLFTSIGATGTWDLSDNYNGTVSVNSVNTEDVVLPTAKTYSDVDITLKGVKENKELKEGNEHASRTDILFEFEDVNKSTSVGLIYKDGGVQVETLGIWNNNITGTDDEETRKLGFYTLDETEEKAYLDGTGVDLRVVRSGLYLYVFINDKQVGMLNLAQNSSGVTADMPVRVSLRHYDIKAEKITFNYELSDVTEEVKLDIASGNGTVESGEITYITNKEGTKQNCSKHFMGEKITLNVAPNRGYKCTDLQIDNKYVGSDTYTFEANKNEYYIEAEYICRIFEDSTTWDVSKQHEGVVSTTNEEEDADKFLDFYDAYTDIDLTLHNVKHRAYNDETGGRTDVLFDFAVDTNKDGVADAQRNISFGIMWRKDSTDTNENGTIYVLTLGLDDKSNESKNLISNRRKDLYKFTDVDMISDYMGTVENGVVTEEGKGVDFRIIRSGTKVDLCVNGKCVNTFDLTMGGTVNITEDTEANVQLRYYDAKGTIEIPFEISDTADHIFNAKTGWDLTDKYNGVVSVDTTPVEGNANSNEDVALPLAKKYGDIDITLKGVKEYKSLNADTETNKVGRTDILFEFDTNNDGTIDKSTSVGLVHRDGKVYVETLGDNETNITGTKANGTRQLSFYTLEGDEADAYLTGDGVDLRVIRSGIYLYVFINGRQVGMLDLTQNGSGVTAKTEAKVSLRHYDINSNTPLSFNFEVSDELQEIELDVVPAEEGVITTNAISHIVYDTDSAKSVVKTEQDITTHFLGETITLTVTPNEGYICTKLQLNGKSVPLDENLTYTFVTTRTDYSVVAIYEAATAETE